MSFSQEAIKIMNARMSDYHNKVGSELKKAKPNLYQNYESTDCITFVLHVLRDTFKKQGKADVARNLTAYGRANREAGQGPKFYGDLLAKALVNKHGWSGIYLTPDKFHPRDGDQEHTFATTQALKNCSYAGVPISYAVLDYQPLDKSHKNFQALYPFGERKLNRIDLDAISKIPFGFGLSRGGMHTWLFSKGFVYEVHWDEVGPNLYDKTAIQNFPWQSNLIVVPPDAKAHLTLSVLKCAN